MYNMFHVRSCVLSDLTVQLLAILVILNVRFVSNPSDGISTAQCGRDNM
jgi:hypothetical protein